MAVTIWVSTSQDKTIELGGVAPVYAAFREMALAAGGWPLFTNGWPSLSSVIDASETGDDVDPTWLSKVRHEAALFLRLHGFRLSGKAVEILEELQKPT